MKMTSYIHRISLGLGATALVLATAAFAQAAQQTTTDKAREAGREVKQDTRDAARDTGNAVTDSWVTMKIHSQFIPEDALEDSDIDVTTRKGVVTLTGTVASLAGRDRAVAIAKATDGVKSVTNRLRVARERDDDAVAATGAAAREGARETKDAARGAGRAVSDGWLTSKVYADFIDEDALEGSDIDVDVNAAVVTLKGTVASQAGSDRAAEVARGIEGVKSVRNNLKVTARK
ncbi:BON domain-containing protein [Luteitalea sp.]|uniref:BON domain-containing protein n=1 Tax=Luteitalea sp. TaxID=2004800 RepID=UPI0025C43B0D|nr:BON domain-containing protein [Luteitalea sp.]